MPIIKSAQKRVRIARKATVRNSKTKRNLKTAVKALHSALKSGDKKAGDALKKAQSAVDQAAKHNVIHKNKAARKKSQLARAAKIAAGVTVAAGAVKAANSSKKAAAPAKKPAAKKAAPKTPKKK
jgi:small subunit ribosomal protein S20